MTNRFSIQTSATPPVLSVALLQCMAVALCLIFTNVQANPYASAWQQPTKLTAPQPANAGEACRQIQQGGVAMAVDTAGSNSVQQVQAGIVPRAPELLLAEEPFVAGSRGENEVQQCRAPLAPLDQSTPAADINLNLDLEWLDYRKVGGSRNVRATARTADPGLSPTAQSPQRPAIRYTGTDSLELSLDQLPTDTSDHEVKVSNGCSETTVPLDSLQPAMVPGVVLAHVSGSNAALVAQDNGLRLLREIPLGLGNESLAVLAGDNALTLLAQLLADARVQGAQPEYVYRSALGPNSVAPQDPLASLNYGPAQTGALQLQQQADGSGQRIAVIDTGVDLQHPDLAGHIDQHLDVTDQGWVAEAHGTAVAGIIAAKAGNNLGAFGVAPGARIFAIKACHAKQVGGLSSRCWTSTLVQAIDAAVTSGVDIINLSLTGPEDKLLARYIQMAVAKGVMVIAAAGNGGPLAKPAFPAALPDVLAVTAIDVRSQLYTAANRGGYIDIAAPGVQIVTTAPNGRYPNLSGTSFAAAHVSGAVALLKQLQPTLDTQRLRQLLPLGAADLGAAGRDDEFGGGRVNFCATASQLLNSAPLCEVAQ